MIRVEARTSGGVPIHIMSTGHADRPEGTDSVPCAAVSLVLKALGLSVARNQECLVRLRADRPGEYDLTIAAYGDRAWLSGVWTMAASSLREIEATWPDQVQVTMIEEKKNGT